MAETRALGTINTDDLPGASLRNRIDAADGLDHLAGSEAEIRLNIEQFQFNGQILSMSSLVSKADAGLPQTGQMNDITVADTFIFNPADHNDPTTGSGSRPDRTELLSGADQSAGVVSKADSTATPIRHPAADHRKANSDIETVSEDDFLF